MKTQKKFLRLKEILRGYNSCVIAFSGGSDSSFLLKAASLVLAPERVLAVTAYSATYPQDELARARHIAASLGVRHKLIRSAELQNKNFVRNTLRRCYFCKKELFSKLREIADGAGLRFVLDAANLTDQDDFRPGSIAAKEMGVCSPLKEAGLKKEEIRLLSKHLGLGTWDEPSSACLASRIPYGTRVTRPLLERIERAERFLKHFGFNQLRLRHHHALCRIEVGKDDLPLVLSKSREIVRRLKRSGYEYITLDLEGYRTGSLNEVLKK